MNTLIRNSYPYRLWSLACGCVRWGKHRFAAPSPHFIKQSCLIRNGLPNAVWVETGTYLGQTTQLLSKYASKVYSIEPEPILFSNAAKYFKTFDNVEILNGLSENIFPDLLPRISGDVNFWLDGHYSGGITHKGPKITPIVDELKCIGQHLPHFSRATVLIDDIRGFDPRQPKFSAYPSLDFLVDWARENQLSWHIEHDIFVAKNY